MVIFSQGNLEYLGLGNHFWRFSDNQFDFRGRYQSKIQNQYDRDLFAWGANGYFKAGSLVGNGIKIWGANNDFGYSTATELTGTSEWGNNKIANAGNRANSGWRTLTEQEMNKFCEALPRYKRPRKYIFAEVPRNATGKIEKPKLRKMYGADKLVAEQNQG